MADRSPWHILEDYKHASTRYDEVFADHMEIQEKFFVARRTLVDLLRRLPAGTLLKAQVNGPQTKALGLGPEGEVFTYELIDAFDLERLIKAKELTAPETNGDADAIPNEIPTALVPPSPDLGKPVMVVPADEEVAP